MKTKIPFNICFKCRLYSGWEHKHMKIKEISRIFIPLQLIEKNFNSSKSKYLVFDYTKCKTKKHLHEDEYLISFVILTLSIKHVVQYAFFHFNGLN